MKNFVAGLLIGVLATYWYLTQRDYTQSLMVEMWSRASRPPAAPRANPAH